MDVYTDDSHRKETGRTIDKEEKVSKKKGIFFS